MPNEKPASPTAITKDEKPNSPAPDLNKQIEADKPTEKKFLKVPKAGIIDLQNLVEAQARDIGDARMTEDKESRDGNRFTRFVKKIWKHNYAQEHYRQKEIAKVKKQILETGNLYSGEEVHGGDGANTAHSDEAKKAIIEKFTNQYADEILREEEKDSRSGIDQKYNDEFKELIKDYASGAIDEVVFNKRKEGIIEIANPNYAKEKNLYADNLLDIAKEVQDVIRNGESLEKLDFDVQVTLGKARESLDTEAKKTTFDKILNHPLVSKYAVVQSLLQSSAITLAYSGGKKIIDLMGRKGAKWFGFGAGLAASGAIEAYKEGARVERDRAQHIRERAKGVKFTEEDMKRRQEMEKNKYDTKSATDIISGLDNALSQVERGNLTEAEIRAMIINISDLDARVRAGAKDKMDLISYDSFENIEKDRTAMLVKGAELKVALRKINPNFDSDLENRISTSTSEFSKEKGLKDEVFKKMKRRRMWTKAGQSILIGGAMSFAIQEVYSLGTHEDGIIEGSVKGIRNHFDGTPGKGMAHDTTAMESLRRWIAGDGPRMPMGTENSMFVNGAHLHLPEGATLHQHLDGHGYDLKVGDKIISNVDFDSNGNLTPEAIKALHSADVYTDVTQVGETVEKTITHGSAEEYLNKHPELTHKIHRDIWYENDTKPFDQNELRGWWGGPNNTGIDQDGNYVFNMSHMTNDGSFHGAEAINAKDQINSGNLKMAFSFSQDTQHQVFEVDIDKNGNAIIPKDSELAKHMFKTVDGHAVFTGKFAEVAQSMGMADDGGENLRILATHIGENKPNLEEIIKTGSTSPDIRFSIPLDSEIEPPLPIPPIPRTPMERGSYAKKDTSKQGPAKDKGIEKVKDLQSKNPIEGAVDPLKTGAEDLTKNEKVPVTEADFDENIKNARAEEAAVFAEFSEWEKNRKTPEERVSRDLEDRYAAAQTKVANAEKAKAEFMARTDNEPAPAPASSEVNPTNPIVAPTPEGSENIEQKEKAKWIMVEDKEKGFGITNPDRDDYFYDKDGQTYWSKDRKVIRNLINKLNNGEEIESVSDLNKQPEEQILSDKDLETRYALDEEEQDLSDKLLSESKLKESADKAITDFTNKKTNKGKPIPQKLLDASSVAEMRLRNAQDAFIEFVSTREDLENRL